MLNLFKRILDFMYYRFAYKCLAFMPDKLILKILFRYKMGRRIDFNNVTTYNEKLQWLKLYDRKPIYTTMVDKYLVKDYVARIIGEKHIIPTIGVWDKADDIDFDSLPNRFVLKCNHNSGTGMYICKDKSALSPADICRIKKDLNRGLAENFYTVHREWPYKDVLRKIIAEEYMEDSSAKELRDYKVYCFCGEPRFVMVNQGRTRHNTTANYYDTDYNQLDFLWGYPKSDSIEKIDIELYREILEKARILSKDLLHIRVDFYVVDGRIYFGEMTFFDGSGFAPFDPPEWDEKLGSYLTLPTKSI